MTILKRCHRILPLLGAALWIFVGANEYSIRAQYESSDPAPAQIAPAAQAALDKMTAAYKGATFYSSGVKIYSSGLDDSPPAGQALVSATIAWAKPNKINISGTGEDGATTLISNGATFWETTSLVPGAYLQHKAAATKQIFMGAMKEMGADDSMLARLMAGQDPLRRFGSSLQKVELKKISAPDASGKMQIATDRVAVVATFARRKDSGTGTFVIGNDGLLRSFRIEQTKDGQPASLKEIYDNASVTPDNTSFEYSPPPGTQMVTAFPSVQYDPRLVVGADPLPIRARDLDGKIVNLDDYKGQVVLLDFWATWCPPCREELPNVLATYQRHKDKGFNIVGISLDDDKAAMLNFTATNNMTWRQIFDGGAWKSAVPVRYKVNSIPFTVLIGRDGKIAAIGARGPYLESVVADALAKK